MRRRPIFVLPLLLLALFVMSSTASADNILLTQYDNQFNGGTDVYAQMKSNLEADGHTVSIVDARVGGNIATALGAGSYDQVFLFDLTSATYINGADLTALASFWGTHSSLVVDTRSYGYYFQGAQASEVQLLQNIASEMSSRGGGVWVGTDHDPQWTRNANPFLAEIGVDLVTGIHSEAVNTADPALWAPSPASLTISTICSLRCFFSLSAIGLPLHD